MFFLKKKRTLRKNYQEMKDKYIDAELIAALQTGGLPMQTAMRYVYLKSGWRKKVLDFVKGNGGTQEEAKDLFQKMALSFWMNIRAGKFRGEGSLEAYFMQMCRKKWYSRFNKIVHNKEKEKTLEAPKLNSVPTPDSALLMAEKKVQLEQIYERLGKGCKEVLSLRFMNYKPAEIAEKTGYKDASKRFSECKKKLTALLLERPDIVELIRN